MAQPASGGRPAVILVMGVASSGKTSLGERLAERLGWPFRDADSFHPPENVAKMAGGAQLVDPGSDRGEPGLAVLIGQRRAARHLGDILGRVKGIGVAEGPAETPGQPLAQRGLARAGDAHDDDD